MNSSLRAVLVLWILTALFSPTSNGALAKREVARYVRGQHDVDQDSLVRPHGMNGPARRDLATSNALRDVVIIIDGSGSINSSDWSLQKDGFIQALKNPLYVPRDGSVALAVVQFSAPSPRSEFSYTIVKSETDVNNAIQAISNMVQIGDGTNPGDGVALATSILAANIRSSANQIFCMSTDGTRNSGQDTTTALNNAKNSAFGLDSFSVIAIEDPERFIYEQDFRAEYGNLVFGGGQLFVVRNTVEFSNTVGALCFNNAKSVNLVGIEVVQVVQDLTNSVELIEKKETWVRVYFEPVGPDPVLVAARLRGRNQSGVELPWSPLTATNQQTADHPSATINARPKALSRRGNMDDSLNFQLSRLESIGTIQLEVEAVGTPINCKVTMGPFAVDCKGSVAFIPVPELRVIAKRVIYNVGPLTVAPFQDLLPWRNRLLSIYPVHSIDFQEREFKFVRKITNANKGRPDALDGNDLLTQLKTASFLDSSLSDFQGEVITHGVLSQNAVVFVLDGKGQLAEITGVGYLGGNISISKYQIKKEFRNTHAHEIGHNLGLPHPYTTIVGDNGQGVCGESAKLSQKFPFLETVAGKQVYTIGPLSNVADEAKVFGWDTNVVDRPDVVIDPTQHFELMSYCFANGRWISSLSYKALRTAITSRFSIRRRLRSLSSAPTDYIIFRGIINLTSNVTVFSPTVLVTSLVVPAALPAGDLDLVIRNRAGVVIQRISFQPEPIPTDDVGSNSSLLSIMLIPVVYNASFAKATVERGGLQLGSVVASTNLPQVRVLFPNGGEVLSGNETTFSWTASDQDGDALTFTVQFSRDNGSSWTTLVVDYEQTSMAVPLHNLGGTTSGLIRVLVSDGFNVAQDTSDAVFTTPNVPPQVRILPSSLNGSFTGTQRVLLEAYTKDLEDGALVSHNITWTSDRNGYLGSGEILALLASDLQQGGHVISVTGIDSSGAHATDSLPVQVYQLDPQKPVTPPPTPPPTPRPTIPATPKPTTSFCHDNPRAKFYVKELKQTHNCRWLATHIRMNVFRIGKKGGKIKLKDAVCGKGGAARNACRKTCGVCH